nr:YciI family protein [Arcticibacterium luteifluviistationis]
MNLHYKVPLEEIDKHLPKHIEFLNVKYALENFIASGRKVPRTSGNILSKMKDKAAVEMIINKDPFRANNLADYALI